MIDINELRRLAQAATPGPWFSDARGNIWRRPLSDLYENGGSVAGDKPIGFVFVGWRGEGVTGYPVENNARLIAASNPSAVIELLDRLEAAEKGRDALRAEISAMKRQAPAMWVNSANIASARINRERGGIGDQHTCTETKTAYHDAPLYALPGAKGEEK